MDDAVKNEMYENYQPWVIKTYGDLSRTKTITLKKRARIFKILRGEEQLCAENSKFRFWVRNKGFRIDPPEGYVVKPADSIVGRNVLGNETGDLYVPGGNKDIGSEYKKVAIVENFFDIIYGVHVEIDGRNGRHAGQKRTYRTITETYAFLPREAVTKFLLNCSECQKRPNSPAVRKIAQSKPKTLKISVKSIESLFPTPQTDKMSKPNETDVSETTESSNCEFSFVSEQNSPENLCKRDGDKFVKIECQPKSLEFKESFVNTSTPIQIAPDARENVKPMTKHNILDLISNDSFKKLDSSTESEKSRENETKSFNICNFTNMIYNRRAEASTGSDTSDSSFENLKSKRKIFRKPFEIEKYRRGIFERNRIIESSNNENVFPICYPLPKFDGRKKLAIDAKSELADCFDYFHHVDGKKKFEKEEVSSVAEPEPAEEETPYSGTKEAEKLKMMLLAWNASGGRNGERLPEDVPDEASQIWAGYHNALSLSKQTPPIRSSPTQETGSVHDETSSSGNKDDDDDEEEESEEKIDPMKYDPERLKAFNMFVRLFVDENLDRIVPISKQPKEKIQAIIDSCTRQFPEFSERARKRIRTYLKSCRRNKRTREGNTAWEPVRQSRPTPAHLTSVQAEQILAQACENESHNAKRMRLGLEPVTQPMPGMTTDTSTTVRSQSNNETTRERDHYTSPVSSTNAVEKHSAKHEPNSGSVSPTVQNKSCSLEALAMASANSLSPNLLNGSAPPSSVAAAVAAAAAAPTAMYRPNFTQAFQRAAAGTYTTPGLFSLPCSLTNGTRPTDLSMKNKPLLTHKLNPAEMTAVRQLITGYRESAAFLLRSADELEQLLRNQ